MKKFLAEKYLRLLFVIYAVLACTSLFLVHVNFFSLQPPLVNKPFSVMPKPYTFAGNFKDVHSAFGTSSFRQSAARTGLSFEPAVPFRLAIETVFPNLNLGVHSASKASPAVDSSGIYVGSDGGWFYAIEPTHQVRWSYFASDAINGIHSTAALDELYVYFGTYAGDLVAAEKQTGKVRWIAHLGETIGSSPVLVGDSILVAVEINSPRNGYLVKLDRNTGKLIWRSEYFGEQSHSSPAVDTESKLVFVGANNDIIYCLRLADGTTQWQQKTMGKIKSSPAIVDDQIYFTNWAGFLISMSEKNGDTLWMTTLGGRSQSSPSYVPDADMLIVSSENGLISGIDRSTGKIIWTYATHSETSRVPSAQIVKREKAVGPGGSAFAAWISCGENFLCAFEPKSGQVLAHIKLPGLLTGMPVAYAGKLYLALDKSDLVSLIPSQGKP